MWHVNFVNFTAKAHAVNNKQPTGYEAQLAVQLYSLLSIIYSLGAAPLWRHPG